MLPEIQGKPDQRWDVFDFIDFRDERQLIYHPVQLPCFTQEKTCTQEARQLVQGHTASYIAELGLVAGFLVLFHSFFQNIT